MSQNGARPKKTKGFMKETRQKKDIDKVTTTSDPLNRFSVRLYDVLDKIGASEEFRKLRQDCAIASEVISTIMMDGSHMSVFIFGSSSEGTTTPGLNSDTDILLSVDNIKVVENVCEANNTELVYSTIREKDTKPGYVKLHVQCKYDGQSRTIDSGLMGSVAHECDKGGRVCLPHVSMIQTTDVYRERNGPADTIINQNRDVVFSYRCSKIPMFAREWIKRNRQFKWPTKRMLKKMSTMGCFFVGVGHPASDEKQIEWRISFSLQERELMYSMTAVQHKCYIVLKMIKKGLIEPIVGKSITSYHLKTLMFYVLENTKASIWKRTKLLQCVLLVLHILLKWTRQGYCPNYFMKDENMFDREILRSQRLHLLSRLQFLISNYQFIFDIQLDQVGSCLRNGTKNVQIEQTLSIEKVRVKLEAVSFVFSNRCQICIRANTANFAIDLMKNIVSSLSKLKRISDHTEHQTKAALLLIQPIVHLQLAQSYSSLAFSVQSVSGKDRLLETYGNYLHKNEHSCLTMSKLLHATVLYKMEKYEMCILTLDTIEKVFTSIANPLLACKCFGHTNGFNYIHGRKLVDDTMPSILNTAQPCIIFLRSDMPIIPGALQFEFYRSDYTQHGSRRMDDAWFDLAVVDAIAYFHFLRYLAYSKLKLYGARDLTILNLESVITSEIALGHRETGYNLLGWIHFNEGSIQQGIKYFRMSWAKRPYHNAAKFHMLKMFID